jgi:hypothetical protein
MKTINLQDRLKVCKSAMINICMNSLAIGYELNVAKHNNDIEQIARFEKIAKELELISNLLDAEMDRLCGVHKYNPN